MGPIEFFSADPEEKRSHVDARAAGGRVPMSSGSDLEMVVLGIVWKWGPMTPYAIRQEFDRAPSSHFSASTGAIYPLVRRLEGSGHLASREEPKGKRPRRIYDITRQGTESLRSWLRPPLPDGDISVPFDPVRVRLYFLAALPPSERREYIEEVEQRLRGFLGQVTRYHRQYIASGDLLSELAAEGTIEATRSRLRALAIVRKRLDEIIARHTGQPLEKVAKDTERDFFMSSAEAKEYGIVDRVIDSH